jgi:hypothetical protein
MTNHWISMGVPNVWVIHAAHQGINGSIRPDFAVGEMFVNATNPFQFQYFNISIDQGHILQQEASHDISIPRNT